MPQKRDPRVDSFWGYIFRGAGDQAETDHIRVLGRIPLFDRLSRRDLRKVLDVIHVRRYEAGEYLFTRGQPGAAMFIIRSGAVDIVVPGRDGGDETVLATLTDATFLGELALLDDSPRSASARAVEPTEAFALFRSDLNKLLEAEPEIASKILRQLALAIGQRLKATNEQLSALKQQHPESDR